MGGAADPERAALTYHGGSLDAARRLFPDAPEPWIDLSTGINPWRHPIEPLDASAWARLPQATALAELEAAAAQAYGARFASGVIAAPGTQALVQLLPRLVRGRKVGILGLTYSEHERSWRRAGVDVQAIDRLDDLAECDVAVIVNPNNPDGRLIRAPKLAKLAQALAAQRGTLIVDEAFMDVVRPSESLVLQLPQTGAIVLRSFGKVFGLAGLRLGFAVASPDIAPALREALGPWAVSGPAITIGTRALGDRGWLAKTIDRLAAGAARLDRMLHEAGLRVIGGTPLFRLAAHEQAGRWFERLGRAGILARPFAARSEWLRFGIPPDDEEVWSRLRNVLQAARRPPFGD
ncbi:MAG: threonine-phosphate decarboxylase [Methylobacteriaceae bacterium]|nr:threonine-phosphate decarboxylase [Methylobacteriaceae bacterium]